ncbi:PRC-barrel domain-containing protein [Fimbriimonas ginsengisoli]|uniref:Putative PRC-barrel domain protein n=1 Tax=Fimbriimonas ginsengisoli Gsoil 348 TaxID=661478 RepID=A0A068NW51_FIMGI|nr:PRC-barrel domain-containing protein [Fimbriimonas ginsengisoli]AIE85839.1 putative PRC-barrel domain protein [Fimbriimonas ginsengisoli Gsoil 348]
MKQKTQKISGLIGRPVVSIAGGVKVGTVKDVLIDADTLKATALLISGDSGRGGLPFAQVIAIGDDAVTIENVESVFWASATSPGPGREAHEINGLPVVDSAGINVGSVHDIELVGDCVKSLDVRSGGLFGIGVSKSKITSHAIRTIGPKMVTVEAATPSPV